MGLRGTGFWFWGGLGGLGGLILVFVWYWFVLCGGGWFWCSVWGLGWLTGFGFGGGFSGFDSSFGDVVGVFVGLLPSACWVGFVILVFTYF